MADSSETRAGGAAEAQMLERLMLWYQDQCDGEWEHQYGITIESLDNPGWQVKIDTVGTGALLADRAKQAVDYESERDWMIFWVEGGAFRAAGGPQRLDDILKRFLDLVGR
jgi:hypothetical protein